jgi:hypothetical protein
MAKPQRATGKIDRLMEKASEALEGTKYFECERLCLDALEMAHASADYERMARIILPLQEARRQKRLAAVDAKKLFILEEPIGEDERVEAGCYLLQPPLVGADGRDLRERADREEVPVFVLVREPKTRIGQWPLVMIGPVTVRTRVKPPKNEDRPDLTWFLSAGEAIGDSAISQVNPEATPTQRVGELYDRLGTITEHEKLHQSLEEASRHAAAEALAQPEGKPLRSRRKAKAPPPASTEEEE